MNVKFKNLFHFTKTEIDTAFAHAKMTHTALGLKLLTSPLPKDSDLQHGKLLVITPRRSGKAHKRNKIRRQIKALYYEENLYEKKVIAIVLVYKEAMELDFDKVKQFLIQGLEK